MRERTVVLQTKSRDYFLSVVDYKLSADSSAFSFGFFLKESPKSSIRMD